MLTTGELFAGYGGLGLAVNAHFGAETAWVSEIDPAANLVLSQRFPDAPNIGDVTSVAWRDIPRVDILTGGFPCQDVSLAGSRHGMRKGNRTGLWAAMTEAIEALRPPIVVAENVRGLLSSGADSDLESCPGCMGDVTGQPALRALGRVLGDLAELRYDARWVGLRAADAGAPHGRFRVFVVARDALDDVGPRPGPLHGQPPRGEGPTGRADRPAEDPHGATRDQRWEPTAGQEQGGRSRADARRRDRAPIQWGKYRLAVERWEDITGHPAPNPVGRSRGTAKPTLDPPFVEWMMGLPPGWVTGLGLSRRPEIRLLGNGVVPQQARLALDLIGG